MSTGTLTPAERRYLQAMIEHGRQKVAAHKLGITLNTAKERGQCIRAKLGVSTMLQAAAMLARETARQNKAACGRHA